MPDNSFSRRSLLAAAGAAAPAAAAAQATPQAGARPRSPQDPIRIVTMYKFDPAEIDRIQRTVPNTQVEIQICATREEFRQKLRLEATLRAQEILVVRAEQAGERAILVTIQVGQRRAISPIIRPGRRRRTD